MTSTDADTDLTNEGAQEIQPRSMAGGTEVLGVDADPRTVQSLAGRLTHVVEADSTNEEAMRQLGVHELERAVSELGLLGAYVGTDLGRELDDAAFDPVYEACVRLDVPLFIHPAPGGIDAPRRDARLARFDADLWLGFAYEETLAVATLVLGGVLARHPDLDVCISHGGGGKCGVFGQKMR